MARLILAIFIYALAASASALDSWEHKRLSDLAYHLAVEIHCPDNTLNEMCAELRPEISVDVSRAGALGKWCESNAGHAACQNLEQLYQTFPQTAYENSRLRRICQNPNGDPACNNVAKLAGAARTADPVSYRAQRDLLRWCHKNPSDRLCPAIQKMVRV